MIEYILHVRYFTIIAERMQYRESHLVSEMQRLAARWP